jgi:NADH dehydrogenase/NADH:ubiquinone oxidoreductase subunit G
LIRLEIDEYEIETSSEQTVLSAAREHGFEIPTLCYHEALEPFAACRLCMVEVNAGRGWQLVASCAYPCSQDLQVRTQSEAVLQSRRATVELLMASAGNVPAVNKLAEQLGVSHPRFTMETNDCILCGLCVRACEEIVGVSAISVINRGIEKQVSTPFSIASGQCIECGTCVLVCPTGAIRFEDITGGRLEVHEWESEFAALECRICGQDHSFTDHDGLFSEAVPALEKPLEEAKS